jgi:tetratricopeptide (TPR) repeat protein
MNDEGDLALSDASRAIELDGTNAYNFLARCRAYRELEKYSDALSDCNKAVALAPNASTMRFNRGMAYLGLQQWNNVIDDMQAAVKLDESADNAWYWQAKAYYELANYDSALQNVGHYLTIENGDADALLLRAEIELKQGKRDLALSDGQAALKAYRVHDNEGGINDAQAFLKTIPQ